MKKQSTMRGTARFKFKDVFSVDDVDLKQLQSAFGGLLYRARYGYDWVNGKVDTKLAGATPDDKPPFLVPKGELLIAYRPLQVDQLHRNLASLGNSRARINAFANECGNLGHSVEILVPGRTGTVPGVSLARWVKAISELRRTIQLWDDRARAQRFVERRDRRVTIRHSAWQRGERITRVFDRDTLAQLEDAEKIVSYIVQERVNSAMRGHVSPVVFPLHNSDIGIVPDCLLSAAYLSFALEISGRQPARLCPVGHHWFTPGEPRQKYCSDRHRWVFNKMRGRAS
jgi:hypothetical protein